jgi:hypothetical protein
VEPGEKLVVMGGNGKMGGLCVDVFDRGSKGVRLEQNSTRALAGFVEIWSMNDYGGHNNGRQGRD